jgi:leucine dehydrogenase
VLAVPTIPRGSARRELFARYAAMVETLGGGFLTGPDMNLTIDDLELMRQHSTHIFGTSAGVQEGRSISDATALGVLGGIRACLRHVHGDATLVGRTVLVQGIGGVGGPLTKLLVAEGAEVLVSDVNDARIRTTVERLGVEPVPLEQVLTTQVDVLAPCATGGVVGPEDVPRLGARIVAGCANNPLRGDGTADALEAAGVLYAPDFVINAGGALHGIAVEGLGWSSAQVLKGIEAIGATLVEIFRTADAQGISTSTAAERLAAERLRAPAGHSLEPEATASA